MHGSVRHWTSVQRDSETEKATQSKVELRWQLPRNAGPHSVGRKSMIKVVAAAFIVAIASSAQAMPRAAVEQPDSLVTTVREACGAGMHRVNGVCVRTPARRQAARCAAGLRYVGGRCIR